jgi:DNA repair exonuclease SbcCD ATPase subunit
MAELQESHNQQLGEYLRFLRRKRDGAIAEVAADFRETKETRLFDDSYGQDDVAAIVDGLLALVRSTMKRDLQTTMFSSVLLLKQAFEQAEAAGLSLDTDLPTTEDQRLLQQVEQWDQSMGGGGAAPPLRTRAMDVRKPVGRGALPVIGQTQDPKLASELGAMKDDHATLQERFNRLQVQCSDALREKSSLQAQLDQMGSGGGGGGGADASEVEMLRAQVAELQAELQNALDAQAAQGAEHGSGVDSLMRELHAAQDANAEMAAEIDTLRAEAEARLERSPQFVNLRQMLGKKNSVVRQLRETLQAHGIHVDDVDAGDD